MAELKPCPFCGGSDIRIEKIYDYYEVLCCDCLSRTEEYSTNEEAIEAWNNRPSPWHTGTPAYRGRYLVSNGYDTSISYFDGKEFVKDFLGFPDVGDIVKWQKIES